MIQLPLLFAVVFAASIAAFDRPASTPSVEQTDDRPNITINQVAAPAQLTARMADNILRAEQAAIVNLNYTPGEETIYYFDASGAPADNASAGGYYRKLLGSTADGRLVGQDFFQDSGKPQTAPFILARETDPHDFDSTNSDSKIVWYNEDGSVNAMQEYRDQREAGRWNYYENGILAIQSALPEGVEEADDPYRGVGELTRGTRFYYPDGKIMAFTLKDANGDRSELLYREDGTPLTALFISGTGGSNEIASWTETGEFTDIDNIKPEIDRILERREALVARLKASTHPADQGDNPAAATEDTETITP